MSFISKLLGRDGGSKPASSGASKPPPPTDAKPASEKKPDHKPPGNPKKSRASADKGKSSGGGGFLSSLLGLGKSSTTAKPKKSGEHKQTNTTNTNTSSTRKPRQRPITVSADTKALNKQIVSLLRHSINPGASSLSGLPPRAFLSAHPKQRKARRKTYSFSHKTPLSQGVFTLAERKRGGVLQQGFMQESTSLWPPAPAGQPLCCAVRKPVVEEKKSEGPEKEAASPDLVESRPFHEVLCAMYNAVIARPENATTDSTDSEGDTACQRTPVDLTHIPSLPEVCGSLRTRVRVGYTAAMHQAADVALYDLLASYLALKRSAETLVGPDGDAQAKNHVHAASSAIKSATHTVESFLKPRSTKQPDNTTTTQTGTTDGKEECGEGTAGVEGGDVGVGLWSLRASVAKYRADEAETARVLMEQIEKRKQELRRGYEKEGE